MTTNQTIDGVPRELLYRVSDPYRPNGQERARAELRALLDAPEKSAGSLISVKPDVLRALFAPNANAVQLRDAKDAARKAYEDWSIAGQNPAAQPQGDPVGSFDKHMQYMHENIDLKKRIAELEAAQSNGKPVAWICHGPEGSGLVALQWSHLPTPPGLVRKIGLCLEQPAPVAVVLPERREVAGVGGHAYYIPVGWNACLDELKRLNPSL